MTTNCDTPLQTGGTIPPPPPHPEGPAPQPMGTQTAYGWNELCADVAALGGLQPQILDGLFMNALADHFSDPSHIWSEDLRGLIWSPDPSRTKIAIFPVSHVERTTSLDIPAIIVKPGAFKSTRIAIGDADDVDPVAGPMFTRRIDGGHTFIVSGGSGSLVKSLGWELYAFFEAFGPLVRQRLGADLSADGIGEIAVLSDLGNKLAVPVTVNYTFLSSTSLRPIDPSIKVFSHNPTITL